MAKERISASVGFKTKRQIKEAAEALGVSESKFVEQAVITDLNKLDIREDLKQVASKLGVPNTVEHCQQRIQEIEENCENASAERDDARQQRDHFKAKFEEAQEELTAAGTKIEALEKRGLFARIFNRPPKV